MTITVHVRFDDQQNGAALYVRVLQFPKNSNAVDRAKIVAEGKTRANGMWLFNTEELAQDGRFGIVILDPEADVVLHRTRTVQLKNFPDRLSLTVSRTPPSEGEDFPDTPERPDRPQTPDTPDRPAPPDRPSLPQGGDNNFPQERPEDLPDTSGPPRGRYADLLRGRLDDAARIKQDEDEITGERTRQGYDVRREGREFADRFVGKRPLDGKVVEHYLPADSSLESRENDVMSEAAERFGGRTGRGIIVRPGDIADGLRGDTIPENLLPQLMNTIMPGNRAEARQDPISICRAMKAAAAAKRAMENQDADGGAPAPPIDEDEGDISGHPIDAIVARLMGTTAITTRRPGLPDVAAGLNVDIPLGPADVTSYYDYHNLQIAWADTWTGMVDGDLTEEVKELYNSLTETYPGWTNENALQKQLGELDDLHELLDTLSDVAGAMNSNITVDSTLAGWLPEIGEKWGDITPYDREKLSFLYEVHLYVEESHTITLQLINYEHSFENTNKLSKLTKFKDYSSDWLPSDLTVHGAYDTNWATTEAYEILNSITSTQGARIGRVDGLIAGLKRKIAQPYQFDVFLPGTYNYGLLTTYRQQWTPITYQPGDLAGTITLAPGETRKYTVSRKSTSKRTSKSSRNLSDSISSESTTTARSESEIMRKTQSAMNAETNAEVGFNFGVTFSGGGSFGFDQANESAQTKNDLREETRKSAQEYKDERKTEIGTETTTESSYVEEREISNPNDELTVTYLFYELQRRFRVREKLHHIRPVIMVAFAVPPPHMINESWLLKYEWILRKVLLDQTLHGTLRMLSQDFAGDELATEVYEEQWKTQIALVAQLGDQLGGHSDMRGAARDAIQNAAEVARTAAANDDSGSTTWQDVGMVLTGGVGVLLADRLFKKLSSNGNNDDETPSTAESAQQALDWATADYEAAQGEMRRGINALEVATDRFVQSVRDRLNRRVEIDKLILHIKTNILHYMQAIWMHENADQRYMRLYDKSVVWPTFNGSATLGQLFGSSAINPMPGGAAGQRFAPQMTINLPPVAFSQRRKLHQIADLSRILGFKGNYAIFSIREPNALTTHMAQDFLDTSFGVFDPDGDGNVPTAEEAIELARCAWELPQTTQEDKTFISDWLVRTLEAAHRISQEIVVPSGELFIEALPGSHPLLEDFKLTHRAHDMAKAAAEARVAELEVLRRAARIRSGDLSDPDIDKRIEVSAGASDLNITLGDETGT